MPKLNYAERLKSLVKKKTIRNQSNPKFMKKRRKWGIPMIKTLKRERERERERGSFGEVREREFV